MTSAVQQIEGVEKSILRLLKSPQPPAMKSLATAFINDCAAAEISFTLTLDDYHTISDIEIHLYVFRASDKYRSVELRLE